MDAGCADGRSRKNRHEFRGAFPRLGRAPVSFAHRATSNSFADIARRAVIVLPRAPVLRSGLDFIRPLGVLGTQIPYQTADLVGFRRGIWNMALPR